MVANLESRSLLNDIESLEDGNADEEEIFRPGNEAANHCHALLLSNKEDKSAEKVLRIVAILSAIFILTEFTGGILANSLSIITDAGHMLSDFLSFIISLIAIRVSRYPATRRVSFGFARAEVLGALMSIFIIWLLTIVLVIFATQRILAGHFEVEPNAMLVTAVLGVIFNVIMATVLTCYGAGFHHDHNPYGSHATCENSSASHTHHHRGGHHPHHQRDAKNVNVRAAFVHVLGDFVQSVGVLTAALVIKFTGWTLADPLCTYLFSLVVLATSAPVFRDICAILMEATPRGVNYALVLADLERIDASENSLGGSGAIRAVHSLHLWALNTRHLCASVHIVLDYNASESAELISQKVSHKLQYKYGIMHTTVQIEMAKNCASSPDGFQSADSNHSVTVATISEDCDYCRPLI